MPDLLLWKDREIKRLKDEMDKAFSLVCEGLNCPDFKTASHPLRGGLRETSEAVVFEGLLTGYGPEDVSVEVSEDSLLITGRTRENNCDAKYSLSGTFRNSFALPGKVDPQQSRARFKSGRLIVNMPRKHLGFYKMHIELD
jgi:HSP20 family molecular chaperone IbpA